MQVSVNTVSGKDVKLSEVGYDAPEYPVLDRLDDCALKLGLDQRLDLHGNHIPVLC